MKGGPPLVHSYNSNSHRPPLSWEWTGHVWKTHLPSNENLDPEKYNGYCFSKRKKFLTTVNKKQDLVKVDGLNV